MKMKCIEAVSESNPIENVGELHDELHEKETTVSCKLLDKNSFDSSKQTNDPALGHEQEQAIMSNNRPTRGYGFRKVSTFDSLQNILPFKHISDYKSTYKYMYIYVTGLQPLTPLQDTNHRINKIQSNCNFCFLDDDLDANYLLHFKKA